MAKASRLADAEDFDAVLGMAHLDDMFDENLANPALALLPAWGPKGLDGLAALAVNGPHASTALSVLTVLSLGRIPTKQDAHLLRDYWDNLDKYAFAPWMAQEAQQRLRSTILEHLSDTYGKTRLLSVISMQGFFARENTSMDERTAFLMDMLVDSHLVLNRAILQGFEDLLAAGPAKEEELHRFLVTHPVLLDPFVTELRTKHELGSDFITDFVVRRTNDEYVVVEIENSTDRLFNQDGSFSADLMKAVGQVRDFQAWIGDNLAYAQKKLPGIRRPEGLVVIGRRAELSEIMEKRLSEENYSRRGHIKIVTFDDLLSQAKVVYRNALERPVILRSKDQKVI
jgi:hypothetical protein